MPKLLYNLCSQSVLIIIQKFSSLRPIRAKKNQFRLTLGPKCLNTNCTYKNERRINWIEVKCIDILSIAM